MGLTHTDLKLENVLFATQEKEVMMDNDLHQRISVPTRATSPVTLSVCIEA